MHDFVYDCRALPLVCCRMRNSYIIVMYIWNTSMNESNLQTILSIAQNYLVATTNIFDRPALITSPRNNKVGW